MDKRKKLIQRLINCGALQVKREQVLVEKELETENQYSEDDIGVTSDGTRYVKSLVMQYLQAHNYPMTPQNVELAAKMAEMRAGKLQTKCFETVISHELENASYEEVQDFAEIALLENVAKFRKEMRALSHDVEYAVEIVRDSFWDGSTRSNKVLEVLEARAKDGWRLINTFVNDQGVSSIGTGGSMDQVVMIFERKKRCWECRCGRKNKFSEPECHCGKHLYDD